MENIFDSINEEKKIPFYKTVVYMILAGVMFVIVKMFLARVEREKKVKQKIKHFKPTIRETMFGSVVDWELRDEPLTNDQLNKIV